MELSARFGFGPTPIREALARLAAETLAVAQEQKGYRVPALCGAELRELLGLRLNFEREAMFRSMREGGAAWEARVVAACHLLTRCDAPQPGMPPDACRRQLWRSGRRGMTISTARFLMAAKHPG